MFDTIIDETAVNNNYADLGNEMANSIAADGQTTPTADLKMGNRKHINVADGESQNHYASVGQLQTGGPLYGGVAGGSANAIEIFLSPAVTSLAEGQRFVFQALSTNTGATTISVNAVVTNAELDGAALVGGEIVAGKFYEGLYDGTATQITRLSDRIEVVEDPAPQLGGPLDSNGHQIQESFGSNVTVGAAITVPTDGNYFNLVGLGNISTINPLKIGVEVTFLVNGTPGFVNGPNLVLLTGANIQCLNGDVCRFRQETATLWRMTSYERADGSPLLGGGELIDHVYAEDATYATTTAEIPLDDTIPQQTEGTEVVTVSITPKNAANILEIEAGGVFGNVSGASTVCLALFRDATADAIGAGGVFLSVSASLASGSVTARVTAGSTSATTLKLRFGAADGVSEVARNGDNTTRIFGGVAKSWIRVKELSP